MLGMANDQDHGAAAIDIGFKTDVTVRTRASPC